MSTSRSSSRSSSSSSSSSSDHITDRNPTANTEITTIENNVHFKWTSNSMDGLQTHSKQMIEGLFKKSKGMCVMDENQVFFLEAESIVIGQQALHSAILPGTYVVHRCCCVNKILVDYMCGCTNHNVMENELNLPIASYFGQASMLTFGAAIACTQEGDSVEFESHKVKPHDRVRAMFDEAGTPCNAMCPTVMTKQQCILFGRCVFKSSVPAVVKNSKPYRLLRCLPSETEFELNGYNKKESYDNWKSITTTDWHEQLLEMLHLDEGGYTGVTTARGQLKHATILHQCTIMCSTPTGKVLQPSIPLMLASQNIATRDAKENRSMPRAGHVICASHLISENSSKPSNLTMLPLWLEGKKSWIESNTEWIEQAKQTLVFVDHDEWLQTDGIDDETMQAIPLSNVWCLSAFSPWSIYHNMMDLDTNPMQEGRAVFVRNGSSVPTAVFETHLKRLYDTNLPQHETLALHMRCLLHGLIGMQKTTMQLLLTHWKKSKMVQMQTGGKVYDYLVSHSKQYFSDSGHNKESEDSWITYSLAEEINKHFVSQIEPVAVPSPIPPALSSTDFIDILVSDSGGNWLTKGNCNLHTQLFEAVKSACLCKSSVSPQPKLGSNSIKPKAASMNLAKLEHTYKSVRSGILTALSSTDVNGQRVMLAGIPAIKCGVCGCDYTEGCSHEGEMHRISRILEWEQIATPLIKAQDLKSLRLTQSHFLSTHNLSMGVEDYHALVGTPEQQLEANMAVIEAAMEWRKDKKAEPRWRIECISEDNTIISGRASPGWEIFTRCISEDHWNKEKNRPTRIPIKASDRERLTRGKRTRNV